MSWLSRWYYWKRKPYAPSEPPYIRTRAWDGTKYIDPKVFLQDPQIRRQLKNKPEETE